MIMLPGGHTEHPRRTLQGFPRQGPFSLHEPRADHTEHRSRVGEALRGVIPYTYVWHGRVGSATWKGLQIASRRRL